MKSVLLAWEQGRGLGRFGPPLEIADRLAALAAARGIELRCYLALRESVYARQAAGDSPHAFLTAPRREQWAPILSHTGSYGDRLAGMGFVESGTLPALLTAWDDVFALTGPDLLIADDSPTAILAARQAIPVAAIGNGYTLPPSTLDSFPPLRARASTTYAEPGILEVVNTALQSRCRTPLPSLPSLLDAEVRGVFSLPQLDPYAAMRTERVLGAYGKGLAPAPLPGAPRIFYGTYAQLEGVELVASVLADSGAALSAHLRGAPSAAARFLSLRGADVLDPGQELVPAIVEASLVVAHGLTGVVQLALALGRPLLVLPTDDETRLLGGQIANLGAGLAVQLHLVRQGTDRHAEDVEAVATAVRSLLDGSFADRAQKLAREVSALGLPDDPIEQVAGRCLDLIAA